MVLLMLHLKMYVNNRVETFIRLSKSVFKLANMFSSGQHPDNYVKNILAEQICFQVGKMSRRHIFVGSRSPRQWAGEVQVWQAAHAEKMSL